MRKRLMSVVVLVVVAFFTVPQAFSSRGQASSAGGCSTATPDITDVCSLGRVNRISTDSRECASCHDGSIGPSALHGEHPFAFDYATAILRQANHYSTDLPAVLSLPAGKVECVTCHMGNSRYEHSLSMPPASLCQACHLL